MRRPTVLTDSQKNAVARAALKAVEAAEALQLESERCSQVPLIDPAVISGTFLKKKKTTDPLFAFDDLPGSRSA